MPNRPKQHELEDLSRAKFQILLPRNWVFRNKDKDYGIDGEVELFDKEGNADGILFYVQLKATSSNNTNQILNVDLKIDTLRYFNKLEIPVLLLRYSEIQDIFYFKWVNAVDLTFAKENSKTCRIKLENNSILNDDSFNLLEKDLKNLKQIKSGFLEFPISYSIILKEDKVRGFDKSIFKLTLRNDLNSYSDYLKYNDENALIFLKIEKGILEIKMGIAKGVYFHSINSRSAENLFNSIVKDILVGVAMNLNLAGYKDNASRIIFENKLDKYLLEKDELLIHFLPYLLDSSYFNKAVKLFDKAFISGNNILLIPAFTTILLNSSKNNNKRTKIIERFFKSQLKKAESLGIVSLIGSSYYNLGNFYSNKNNYYKAITCYNNARKFDINYLNRPYFFREIGGICHNICKYNFSVNFYLQAIALGADGHIQGYLADSLMFSGRYYDAKIAFEKYFVEVKSFKVLFLVRYLLLDMMILTIKIKSQKRVISENSGEFQTKIIAESKDSLESILKEDMLNCLAWFNLGYIAKESKKFEEAMYCYAICAALNPSDIEACILAFILFIFYSSPKIEPIGIYILQIGYIHSKDEFLIQLYEFLETNKITDEKIFDLIAETINNISDDDTINVLRILSQDDYNEISI